MMSLVSFGEEICLLVSIKAACHTRYETVYSTSLSRLRVENLIWIDIQNEVIQVT